MIITGNCIDVLKTLEANSVQTCVTSPPYYGLRDYGTDGQIGLEETPEAYIKKLVDVFAEVKRVLKDDGTLWVNIGDSYNGYSTNRTGNSGYNDNRANRDKRYSVGGIDGLKEKDLIGIPWMLAFALRADGWYLRQDIIWHKPNPMPESVKDRCTKAHEYIFLLSKSKQYYYDNEAIKEQSIHYGKDSRSDKGNIRYEGKRTIDNSGANGQQSFVTINEMKNKRSVWTVTTKPYKEAHFATYPPALIAPCILAGSKVGDTVLDPFNGAGTTGLVALENNREYIGIELNPAYVEISNKRLANVHCKLVGGS